MPGLVLINAGISLYSAENIIAFHAGVKMTTQAAAPAVITYYVE